MKNWGTKNIATRRSLLLTAMAAPLAGCDTALYGVKLSDWGDTLGVASGIESPPGLPREKVAQIPYATIGFKIGDGPESLLILAEKSQTTLLWTSSQRRAIVTANGRIRQTGGFPWNLSSTNFVQEDPVGTPIFKTQTSGAFERICDFADVGRFQVPISSTFEIQAEDTITILDAYLKTTRVVEHCHCEMLDWDFENNYWIDGATGFVWKSIQTVHPNQEPFSIEVLRPPA